MIVDRIRGPNSRLKGHAFLIRRHIIQYRLKKWNWIQFFFNVHWISSFITYDFTVITTEDNSDYLNFFKQFYHTSFDSALRINYDYLLSSDVNEEPQQLTSVSFRILRIPEGSNKSGTFT